MTTVLTWWKGHRKTVIGALSTATAAYSLQVANGSEAVDWKPILASVVAGVLGGSAVYTVPNKPKEG